MSRFTVKRDVDLARTVEIERIEFAIERIGILPTPDRPMGTPVDDLIVAIDTRTVGRAFLRLSPTVNE